MVVIIVGAVDLKGFSLVVMQRMRIVRDLKIAWLRN